MTFGEVIHDATQPTGWPEPVRGITSLLSPFHCVDKPSNEPHLQASVSSSTSSESLASHEEHLHWNHTLQMIFGSCFTQHPKQHHHLLSFLKTVVARDLQLPFGFSFYVHWQARYPQIPQDAQFIMALARKVAAQPSNLIDGHASLLTAHAIFSAPRTHPDRSRPYTRNEEDKDESMYSADSDLCDGSVDSLELPLQAHMLRGRGRRLCAVVPVLLVADSRNIVPLLSS
ncbi:hypothetical protein CY34DRAFT_800766 [Suillus luteus UH-Slu-Lm8-n1]|uniref:Uncharacterized protein n=1 Tax=Suillus luteus UH-Slu-Lm8-n1 TaxID=930992 RepID=A0A0D0AWL6_9AGAM|nr:hypothetical protein CY34DRAFT_800766 [Suillus luteus UH-Slu-Lm8-n1]